MFFLALGSSHGSHCKAESKPMGVAASRIPKHFLKHGNEGKLQ